MTDLDPINPFEAPKQPTVSTDPTIGAPIKYEATPTIDDLNAALRPVSLIIQLGIFLFLMLFLLIGGLLNLTAIGLERPGEILALLPLLLLGLLIALFLYSKITAAKRHLRLNPKATAPVTGELTSKGLRLESENRVLWSSHDGLVSCKVKNRQLSLCHDPQGVAIRILPKRGFRNPELAVRYLEFQANKSSELNMLEPLTGPSMVGDQPADAIAFDGVVKASDLRTSPLETIRKRNVKRMLIWLLLLVVVVLPVIGLAFNLTAMLVTAISIFIVCFLTIRKIRSASNSNDPELPLITIQGWLSRQEIALLHNIGQSRSAWQDFRTVGVNEACIWLQAYSGQNSFILLPRRFFTDDVQWQTAVEIAASHSAK